MSLPARNILAIDTASLNASVAACTSSGLCVQETFEVTTHSEHLLRLVDEALTKTRLTISQLDVVICGLGPGSFTGLRIGLATAKGVAVAASLPFIGMASTDALAVSACREYGDDTRLIVMLDAKRDQIFCRSYLGLQRGTDALCEGMERVSEFVGQFAENASSPIILIGDGACRYIDHAETPPNIEVALRQDIHAANLIEAASQRVLQNDFDDLTGIEPEYFRGPDLR